MTVSTTTREELIDITSEVQQAVRDSAVRDGIAHVFVRGATAALMVQENWDDSVQRDVLTLLRQLAPPGVWEHDRQDGNGDAHLKAGLVGPSESIPIHAGTLALGRWQNLFLCEFDGPRHQREIVVTILGTASTEHPS